jgi:hypothetical protein
LQGTEPKASFAGEPGQSIESLVGYSKGVIAGQTGGLVTLYDKDDREYYRRTRCFAIREQPQKIL